ncbi:ABC transporter ATP-binding protein [Lactobacillus sp. 3B(2020)]|uniref:ATP-binding cassette domain-containing protein n=1 Tax=Lactobacillus sp. 3B(2020) TaxID=2695882 RepID=UPI0015DF1E16|nr:ABC transporter ATP-binding protein [Lactobacillus sp. 3B(2020)]QLL70667.1 ATP-binding cassette domain-containing protein [Lactobacillus sp. 3B(2020)]
MEKLKVQTITKRYGRKVILDAVSFELQPAKIYGLLGRNGAGKSTLLNIITNRIFANQGQVMLGEQNVNNNQASLGQFYLMSEAELNLKHTKIKDLFNGAELAYGNFDFKNARRMLTAFKISEDQTLAKLSTGLKTAAKLTVALNVNADYIFLDEPTLGLDANHRELFYQELMRTYGERPRTFVISTHLINEVQQLLENVIILDQGKIIVDEPVIDLLAKAYEISGPANLVDQYTHGLKILTSHNFSRIKTVTVVEKLAEQRILPDQVKVDHLDLQKTFTALTDGGNEGE